MNHYSRNHLITMIVGGLILLLVGYVLGTQFGSKPNAANADRFAAGQGGVMYGAGGMGGSANFRNRAGLNGSMTMGQVVKNDGTTLTISLPNGDGSRLVMLSASTTIVQAQPVPVNSVAVGSTVSVIGSSNTDGTISAQTVQVR